MINPLGGPVYQQIAAALREKISDGTWEPGHQLPSEPHLAHEFGVGKTTIRAALAALRSEGLVRTERGYRAEVTRRFEQQQVRVPAGSVVAARMPTPAERAALDIGEGVPVFVLGDQVLPADRFLLVFDL